MGDGPIDGGGGLGLDRSIDATTYPRSLCLTVALSRISRSSSAVIEGGDDGAAPPPVAYAKGLIGTSKGTTTASCKKKKATPIARSTAIHVTKTCKRRPDQTAPPTYSGYGIHLGSKKSLLRRKSAAMSARAPARLKMPYCTPKATERVSGVVSFFKATV